MHNQSLFVKIVIWFMVFLMSVGFAGLVIAPFMQGSDLFGDGDGRDATREALASARADVAKDNCSDTDPPITGDRLERCTKALTRVAVSYISLANPTEQDPEAPRDAARNRERAGAAYRAAFELNTKDPELKSRYAAFLRDQGDSAKALPLWQQLVKSSPKNEDYLIQLAVAQQQTQDLDGAIATYRTFIKRFPESGQVDSIKEEIKSLQEQKKQAAAGGGATADVGGTPISIN